jgi:hypothetical protein
MMPIRASASVSFGTRSRRRAVSTELIGKGKGVDQSNSYKVIVHDLHIISLTVVPDEADAVLIVDPNAVLSTPIACQRLEPVAGECREVTEFVGRMELL